MPTVESTNPVDQAQLVPVIVDVDVTFTESMDPATIDETTFTLTTGSPAVAVEGTVIRFDDFASFQPNFALASGVVHTATIQAGVESVDGLALAEDFVFTFTTGVPALSPLVVDLGTAEDFVILSKSGIDTVPTSDIRGDIGVSPITLTAITGFDPLVRVGADDFATCSQVTAGVSSLGHVFAADTSPTKLTTAIGDMELAFTNAAGRPFDVSELGAGNVGGRTLPTGVYKWGTDLLIPAATTLTLSGSATDVFILEIAGNLVLASGASVALVDGALAQNVFWQVSGLVDLGTTAHLEGIVLTETSVAMKAGASLNGRLLAQTAVTLISNTVTEPN